MSPSLYILVLHVTSSEVEAISTSDYSRRQNRPQGREESAIKIKRPSIFAESLELKLISGMYHKLGHSLSFELGLVPVANSLDPPQLSAGRVIVKLDNENGGAW
ncbi:hypothetical protein CEXT_249771 [Caerostris extrusa]|uniref:Uncharacterized protein n=1 Tax=Caerostris extrusa TaxID=172846 RepID=A0AAV4T9S0_CAEEX|nr:hypothetical protein CEXT_249771 [Caerostris extrusa]